MTFRRDSSSVVSVLLVYAALTLLLMYTVGAFVLPVARNRLSAACGYGRNDGRSMSLGYNAWLYRDEEPGTTTPNRVKLGDAVATYAKDRYDVDCGDQCWHVFLRTALGRPLAVRFDSRTHLVLESRLLAFGALDELRLRSRARMSDEVSSGWRYSQFESPSVASGESSNTNSTAALLALARRYSYVIEWQSDRPTMLVAPGNSAADNSAYALRFTFHDAHLDRDFVFEITGYRPSVTEGAYYASGGAPRLPPVSLIARDTRFDQYILAHRAVSNDKSASAINNLFAYESSPCFDRRLGVQTPIPRPLDDLEQFERLYLRSVAGSYPAADRDRLTAIVRDRFYVDCRYDTDSRVDLVDEQLRPSVFPVVPYLRACPTNQPHFDRKALHCRAVN